MRWNEFDAAMLERIPPERLVSDPDLRLAHGTDASFYRLVPERELDAARLAQELRALGALGSGGAYWGSPASSALSGYAAAAFRNDSKDMQLSVFTATTGAVSVMP